MAEKLTKKEVAHVAHLARLAVTDEELDHYTEQLSAILAYVDQLQAVDTTGVAPIGQISGLTNVLAADEPGADSVNREDFLAGAPAVDGQFVKVKAVLDEQ